MVIQRTRKQNTLRIDIDTQGHSEYEILEDKSRVYQLDHFNHFKLMAFKNM